MHGSRQVLHREQVERAPTVSRRVLVADDEPALRRAVARLLQSGGFEVVEVGDGNAAIKEVIGGGFDVIVTDIGMPGSSGIDLLRVVRAYDLDVPVVLITGSPEIESAVEAVELGAIQYFAKPFEPEALRQAVERASRLHRLARLKRDALALAGEASHEAGDRAGLSVRLDSALAKLKVAFQPIVDFSRREVLAHEALMRSDEPSLPNPMAVLAAAERLGRVVELGRRVRGLVADQLPAAPENTMVFVNLHPEELLDPELVSQDSPLGGHAERIVLEITERAALERVQHVDARVEFLRYMGYRIAIDDLGAGYAGLTSFAALEPEFVKLDMSLVRGIHDSTTRQKLVRSLTSVCADMGKRIIAEGVEVGEERDRLQSLGCDLMQGYLFARPKHEFGSVVWD